MSRKKWRELSAGDTIICPADGLPEKVTFSRRYTSGRGRWFVRTSRHDHIRDRNEEVQLAQEEES